MSDARESVEAAILELFTQARLYGWCEQTDAALSTLKRTRGYEDVVRRSVDQALSKKDASKEDLIIALILLKQTGSSWTELAAFAHRWLSEKLYRSDIGFLVKHVFDLSVPLPRTLVHDITERLFFSIESIYGNLVRDFKEVPFENGGRIILYLTLQNCRVDLNAQNKELVCHILTHIKVDVPPAIVDDVRNYLRKKLQASAAAGETVRVDPRADTDRLIGLEGAEKPVRPLPERKPEAAPSEADRQPPEALGPIIRERKAESEPSATSRDEVPEPPADAEPEAAAGPAIHETKPGKPDVVSGTKRNRDRDGIEAAAPKGIRSLFRKPGPIPPRRPDRKPEADAGSETVIERPSVTRDRPARQIQVTVGQVPVKDAPPRPDASQESRMAPAISFESFRQGVLGITLGALDLEEFRHPVNAGRPETDGAPPAGEPAGLRAPRVPSRRSILAIAGIVVAFLILAAVILIVARRCTFPAVAASRVEVRSPSSATTGLPQRSEAGPGIADSTESEFRLEARDGRIYWIVKKNRTYSRCSDT